MLLVSVINISYYKQLAYSVLNSRATNARFIIFLRTSFYNYQAMLRPCQEKGKFVCVFLYIPEFKHGCECNPLCGVSVTAAVVNVAATASSVLSR